MHLIFKRTCLRPFLTVARSVEYKMICSVFCCCAFSPVLTVVHSLQHRVGILVLFDHFYDWFGQILDVSVENN